MTGPSASRQRVVRAPSNPQPPAAPAPGWLEAPSAAIDVFALASARLYDEIARNDPQPLKQRLAAVSYEWACHRLGARSAVFLLTSGPRCQFFSALARARFFCVLRGDAAK
jgi:hypothetical protein